MAFQLSNAATSRTEAAQTFTPPANSIVVYYHADWAATSGKTGTTGTGTFTERADVDNGSNYGLWIGTWEGVTASSTAFGITSYTGTTVTIGRFTMEDATLISYTGPSTWFPTGGTTLSSGTVSWQSGDKVILIGMTEDTGHSITSPTNANLSFNAVANGTLTTGSNEAEVYLWEADAGSTQNSQTITATRSSAARSGIAVLVFRQSSGGVAGSVAAPLGGAATVVGSPAGSVAAGSTFSAVAAGGPAGSVAAAPSFLASAAGTVTGSDVNGTVGVAVGFSAVSSGGPGGTVVASTPFSATIAGVQAVEGTVVASSAFAASLTGAVDVLGAFQAAFTTGVAAAGGPAGTCAASLGGVATVAGVQAAQGAVAVPLGGVVVAAGGPAGTSLAVLNFQAVAAGDGGNGATNGQAVANMELSATVSGSPAGTAAAPIGFGVSIIGQVAGTAAAALAFSATAVGTLSTFGAVVAANGFAAAVGGTPTVVGTAVAALGLSTTAAGGPAGVEVAVIGLGAVAVGSITVVGQVDAPLGFGMAGVGDAPTEGGAGHRELWFVRPEGHRQSDGAQTPLELPRRIDRPMPVPARG